MSTRVLFVLLATWFAALSSARANTMMAYDCPLCGKRNGTSNPDCTRCRFIAFDSMTFLTEAERAGLRTFVASKTYKATLTHPFEKRLLLLYERVPTTAFHKARIYYQGAALSGQRSDAEKLLLEAAVATLRNSESGLVTEADKQMKLVFHAHLLRRLGRLDDAQAMLGLLVASKLELPKNWADFMRVEADMIELKSDSHAPQWKVPDGKIAAAPIAANGATFGLLLNQTPKIANQSSLVKYPLAMRYGMIQGEVVVAVAVSPVGHVTQAKVLRASERDLFDAAALAFARDCRFEPSVDAGSPVAFECVVAIQFNLPQE